MEKLSMFFEKGLLVPVIVQDIESKDVLMLAYANEQAIRNTIETKTAWFYSRSREKLWNKGETSGNFIDVEKILYDCDADTLLYQGRARGPVCHTGSANCFYNELWTRGEKE